MARFHRRVGEKIVVRESPWWVRFLSVTLGGVGSLFVYAGLTGWNFEPDSPLSVRLIIPLIGAFSVICAPFVWRKAPDRRFTFDPVGRRAILDDRSLGKRVHRELNFWEILKVEMEEGRDDEDYVNYRPVLLLTNGEKLPVRANFLASEPCAIGLKAAVEQTLGQSYGG